MSKNVFNCATKTNRRVGCSSIVVSSKVSGRPRMILWKLAAGRTALWLVECGRTRRVSMVGQTSPRPCFFRPSALCTWPSNCRVCCAPFSINSIAIRHCRDHLINSIVDQSIRRAYATANGKALRDHAEDPVVARTQQQSAPQSRSCGS